MHVKPMRQMFESHCVSRRVVNMSMSLSVTSHRFATTHGLPARRQLATAPVTAQPWCAPAASSGSFRRPEEQPMSSETGTGTATFPRASSPDAAHARSSERIMAGESTHRRSASLQLCGMAFAMCFAIHVVRRACSGRCRDAPAPWPRYTKSWRCASS